MSDPALGRALDAVVGILLERMAGVRLADEDVERVARRVVALQAGMPGRGEQVWFRVKGAATYLGMHEKAVRKAHLDGRLRGVRSASATPGSRGGNLRFRREWLDAFAEGRSLHDA